jgi:hypothetical protein
VCAHRRGGREPPSVEESTEQRCVVAAAAADADAVADAADRVD